MEQINIRPDAGYDTMSEVTVNIPVEDVEQTIENNGEYNINAGNSFMKSVRLNVNVAGGGGGDVDLKTFGGKSLKGQGEFLEDYNGIPTTGAILGVTGETYSPTRQDLQSSLPSEFQSAYSYKLINIYGNSAYVTPFPDCFGLYVKKTQEDVGTLLIYNSYDSNNPVQTIVCPTDFADMRIYYIGTDTFFYNSSTVWKLGFDGSAFIFSGYTGDGPEVSLMKWLWNKNVHKQILTSNRTTIISDGSGNLYRIPDNTFIPHPISSFTNFPDGLNCNSDNMYVVYDFSGIIYVDGGLIYYCVSDEVEEFKTFETFVNIDDVPTIYQNFEGVNGYNNYLVSPNSGRYYYIESRYENETNIYSLHSSTSPYVLSGVDLSSEVNGYVCTNNFALILCDGLNLNTTVITDTITDYRLGFVDQSQGVDEWRVNEIAEQKSTEKIDEFKNSGYIENVANKAADSKVDNALYNTTTESTSVNTKDYTEVDLSTAENNVEVSIPYSNPDKMVILYADYTNSVYSSVNIDSVHHSLHRLKYNGQRILEIGLHRKEDGDIAPTVKVMGTVPDYFADGTEISITDENGATFVTSDFATSQTFKLDEFGLTGKKIWIRYQINSNINVTSLDFEIGTVNMRTYAGGVDKFNLFYQKETVHKNNKFAPVSSVKPYMSNMPDALPTGAGDWVLVYNPASGFRFELKS